MYRDELIVDSFAGGGGASTGISAALGRTVDVAINHNAEAISMHSANHPGTWHYCENVWRVDPLDATMGIPVGLLWASPDCRHFSRAKGRVPVKKSIRGLAWVVIRWAQAVRPRVIILENVEEFATWGPLKGDRPDPARQGQTFRRWVSKLRAIGYTVEWRTLVAADFGAPTTRRRLYVIARRDGQPIRWPQPTHGKGQARPWVPASEIIDWSVPCPSIFGRSKPLAEKTQARIAEGVRRYVLECAQPFVMPLTHHGKGRVYGLDHPLPTVTAAHRGELALVAPTLITRSYGERPGQTPRVPGLDKPLGTVVAGGIKHALVAAWLVKHYGGVIGNDLRKTAGTVTARDHHALGVAELARAGTAPAGRRQQVRAFLTAYYGSEASGQSLRQPLRTVTSRDRFGLVTVQGTDYEIADIGMRMLTPRELYRAQGFPADYQIDRGSEGQRLSKTAQIRMVGNSVCPPVAEAIVRANLGEQAARRMRMAS